MTRQIQIRRGTATQHADFTGALGEVTMDTTLKTLRVHDGENIGGTILAKQSEILTAQDVQNMISAYFPGKTYQTISGVHNGDIFSATQLGWIQATCVESSGTWIRLTNTTRNLSSFAAWNGVASNVNANIVVLPGDKILIEYNGNYTFKMILPASLDN